MTEQQFTDAGLDGWRFADDTIRARIKTKDFATGLSLVNHIGSTAQEMNHHPDLDLRYDHVDVTLTSHDAGGVTDRDVRLAGHISGFASEAGLILTSPDD